jgi:hypothetical protein
MPGCRIGGLALSANIDILSDKRSVAMTARRERKAGRKLQGLEAGPQADYLAPVLHVPSVLRQASVAGYLKGRKSERIGGRVSPELLSAAMDKSGLRSQAELLEYALAKVALEDDYGAKLLSMKGSVADDVEL